MSDKKITSSEIIQNILAGLTVSFVAISLGAAFGILSERGAFAGLISAGIISLITALWGGTRIQCSGPTAPMTTVTAYVVGYAHDQLLARFPEVNPDHFINMSIIVAGLMLVISGYLKLGRFISLVPQVVISGFMNGIAILIWWGQIQKTFGLSGVSAYTGGIGLNVAVALVTLSLLLVLPSVTKKIFGPKSHLIPVTLVTIVVMTAAVSLLQLDIQKVSLGATLKSFSDMTSLVASQLPVDLNMNIILPTLFFGGQLALLAYLDSLLTSRVMDKITGEPTHQSKELKAQGWANLLVGFVGGIPGAQATIRSVLIYKEHATLRLAGAMVGVFVLVEMLLFQDLISMIPQSVFAGLLIKVGIDVFDWPPVWIYLRELTAGRVRAVHQFLAGHFQMEMRISHQDMAFIAATTLGTALVNLNAAVITATIVYHLVRRRGMQTEEGVGQEAPA